MTTLAQIKADQLKARKEQNEPVKNLLTTLIGEIENVMRSHSAGEEADVLAAVKSFLKKNLEFQSIGADAATVQLLVIEQQVLEMYLPIQMTSQEIHNALSDNFQHSAIDVKIKGQMMKYLKDHHTNQYDGKLAAQVVDDLIKQHQTA